MFWQFDRKKLSIEMNEERYNKKNKNKIIFDKRGPYIPSDKQVWFSVYIYIL